MSGRAFVMVVDDDRDVRETVADALDEEGYDVVVAQNGRDALRLLRDGARPDLILLDLMMPDVDGWSFRQEQLRDDGLASIPVIVFTASPLAPEAVVELNAQGLLNKPLHLGELVDAVERVRPSAPANEAP